MEDEKKSGKALSALIAVLIIVIAAAGIMAAVILLYQNRAEKVHETVSTVESTEKPPRKIADITNAPQTTEAVKAESTGSSEKDPETNSNIVSETVMPEETGTENAGSQFDNENQSKEITEEHSLMESQEEDTETVMETEPEESKSTAAETAIKSGSAAEYVEQVNRLTISNEASHQMDITALTEISASEVAAMIDQYYLPEGQYLDGAERSDGDFSYAISRRNMSGIKEPVELRYGIVTGNTLVRRFPTWQKISNGTNPDDPDYVQETMLMSGEGVVILHQSEDQIWSFVRAVSYFGWIETSAIAFCDREQMCSYIQADPFIVVTEPVLSVEGVALRMGTRLPLVNMNESGVMVRMAKKDEEGNLRFVDVEVSSDFVSEGYLKLSEEAIVSQAKKLLGVNYGWGDSNAYMDCSSTLRAIYACFGINLPRNTGWMPGCGLKKTDLSQMNQEQKKEAIKALPKGSILMINGHSMMYIGEENGEESMLHNITQYLPEPGAELVRPMKCVITPITICNSSGYNYLELYHTVYSIEWELIQE